MASSVQESAASGAIASPINNPETGFLSLPPELRHQIYGLCFPTIYHKSCSEKSFHDNPKNSKIDVSDIFHEGYEIESCMQKQLQKSSRPTLRPSQFCPCGLKNLALFGCWKCNNGRAGLLLACKQIHNELVAIVYQRTQFILDRPEHLPVFMSTIHSHQHGSFVTRLRLHFDCRPIGGPWKPILCSLRHDALCSYLPNLEYLMVSFGFEHERFQPHGSCPRPFEHYCMEQIEWQKVQDNIKPLVHQVRGYTGLQVKVRGPPTREVSRHLENCLELGKWTDLEVDPKNCPYSTVYSELWKDSWFEWSDEMKADQHDEENPPALRWAT